LGALFAMGGARSLLTVAPIALARTVTESVLRISIFCLGIVVSMVLYGWLTQRALMSLAKFADGRHNRTIMLGSGYAVALFCIVAGAGVLLGKF
jgi:divalent metal cation (Fe/Co/Zn/Cd) transporter